MRATLIIHMGPREQDRGVICLLSALRFHGLTTQAPHELWMVIAHKARRPRADYPPMRVVHFSGKSLSYGVEEKRLEGITVRVFGPGKTVADCFKYRNKIGQEVALEALRDCFYEKVIKVKADVAALHCLISVLVAFGTSGPPSLRLLVLFLFFVAFTTFPQKILR
jgi:hypothetical protein